MWSAGAGLHMMLAIFEDLAENIEKATDAVINALPRSFPDQLFTSVRAAVLSRTTRLANGFSDTKYSTI